MTQVNYKLLNSVNELENNSMKEIEINLSVFGKELEKFPDSESLKSKIVKVLLVKQNNQFYCIGSRCSHYGASLAMGVLYKDRVRCFLHGACFNIKTGDIEEYPGLNCNPKYDLIIDPKTNEVHLTTTVEQLLTTPSDKLTIENLSLNTNRTKVVVIGSGGAGLVCVDKLRESSDMYEITVLTRECHPPYDRPKLSKALNSKISAITLRDEDFFSKNKINYFMNQTVEKIDFTTRKISCLSGKVFDYDRLVIASGVEPLHVSEKVAGRHLEGIFKLKTIDDAQYIMNYFEVLNDKLNSTRKLNIISYGGSFISTEMASFFADKANVTVVSRNQPFERLFGTLVSEKVKRLHETKGVKFYSNNKLDIESFSESAERPGRLGSVKLSDGTSLEADIFLLAIGSKPATHFLKNTDLELTEDNYILVDKYMRTNLDSVYAAGDCVSFPRECLAGFEQILENGPKKSNHINIAHWGVAGSQGRVVAESILKRDIRPKSWQVIDAKSSGKTKASSFYTVPFFWTVHYGKSVRFAGLLENYDKIIFHEDKTKQNEFKFAAFYILKEQVVGVCTLDWDPVCAAFAELMYNRAVVNLEHIEKDPINIKKLLV
jgi:NADH dehydrogenase FAD-containing subunit/nitrite reductase/ring-hydroxylating ferredoxin subunit